MLTAAEAGAVPVDVALGLAVVSTGLLALLHLAAPQVRRLPWIPERGSASFAGGIAACYVFLHLLPELAEGNRRLREIFGESEPPTPIMELGIFLVALVGFCLFYLLERAAERWAADERRARGVFTLHLGSFVLYNAILAYSLPLTFRTGVGFAVLFTVAMGLHFLLIDRGLSKHYPRLFRGWVPRLLLVGALGLGWLVAVFFAPTSAVTVSVLTAFLAGSILLNVFKEEIPSGKQSSPPWFLLGAGLYALLLGAVTYAAA